jgi:hypothetical protein
VSPAGDRNRIGCFANQVKLTHALVQDIDEAIKEIKLLGEHGEEASRKIVELEALRKKLREEKAELEEMVEYHNKLTMDITKQIRLNHMGEDTEENEDEDEDDNNSGDTTAPPTTELSPVPMPPAATREVIVIEEEDPVEMVPEQECLVAHEVILVDAEPEPP